VHLHRVTRDVYADPSTHAVEVPARPAIRLAAGDEAVRVVAVARPFAAAEARHVAQHFGVTSGEFVHRFDDGPRTRERKRRCRQCGKRATIADAGVSAWLLRRRRRRGCRRRSRRGRRSGRCRLGRWLRLLAAGRNDEESSRQERDRRDRCGSVSHPGHLTS
jgi:hypothetical protein